MGTSGLPDMSTSQLRVETMSAHIKSTFQESLEVSNYAFKVHFEL